MIKQYYMFAYSIYGIFLKEDSRRGRKCTDKLTFSHPIKIRKDLYVLTFPFGTPKSCISNPKPESTGVKDHFGWEFLSRIWWWTLAVKILKLQETWSVKLIQGTVLWFGILSFCWVLTGWLWGTRHQLSRTLLKFRCMISYSPFRSLNSCFCEIYRSGAKHDAEEDKNEQDHTRRTSTTKARGLRDFGYPYRCVNVGVQILSFSVDNGLHMIT